MEDKSLLGYYSAIDKTLKQLYEIANAARSRGLDPVSKVEIPCAATMAERVEGLISAVAPQIVGKGIPKRIQELEKKYGVLDWRVSLIIAEEISKERFCKFSTQKEAIEVGLRVGFAYHTLGTVASPLEGFIGLDIRKRRDGKPYLALNYAGPIRSAGGTGASVSVIIGDFLRKKFGFAEYDPTDDEIERTVTEVMDYHERITNLQYKPSTEELRYMIAHLPVQIDGPESSELLVSKYRDLSRIPTNHIRGGVCLVMAECLCQKARKLWKNLSKWGKEFDLEQWSFLDQFLKIQKKAKAEVKTEEKTEQKVMPDYTYIKDIVAGRPVLSHPMRSGGFRLRFGRSRFSGYSAVSLNPAVMAVLDGIIGVGTQLKMERPGKGATVTPCTAIDGPIVKLDDGSVIQLNDFNRAKQLRKQITEIIYLGDILIAYGDFYNRAHSLVPVGYCEEWWVKELEKSIVEMLGNLDFEKAAEFSGLDVERITELVTNPFTVKPNVDEAHTISKHFNIPLHPKFTYYWNELTPEQTLQIIDWLKKGKKITQEHSVKLVLPISQPEKSFLELIGVEHIVASNEFIVISGEHARNIEALGLLSSEIPEAPYNNSAELVSAIAGVKIRDKLGTFIGARMGRPEKGKLRKLKGSPHVLFPVGVEGGRMRSIQSALAKGYIEAELPTRYCRKCQTQRIYPVCEVCGSKTQQQFYCEKCGLLNSSCDKHSSKSYMLQKLDIKHHFSAILKRLGMKAYPDLIKGVRGTSNAKHIPEHLAKGVLRAKHRLTVNKDGTIRFDMTQLPVTHFKPREIGTTIEKLKQLGYTHDMNGLPLENEEQIVELKPLDIILPRCIGSGDEGADSVFTRVAQFIDELLVRHYKLKPYYKTNKPEELVGHLVVVLAPHTSAGVVARLIGFSDTQCLFAHPMLHAATRRDCDGDEACVMLLLDTLINFSRLYLPAHRGSTQDAPLVITSKIKPSEIDDMILDMDIASSYPLSLYQAAQQYKMPYDVDVEKVADKLASERTSSNFGYTTPTKSMNYGVLCSSYKTLPTMEDKLITQMKLASKIRAVDSSDVARLVIEKHFIRDIKGNLRKFSMQQFRCVDCNKKFRRPPLIGKCDECGGNLIFTISKGSVVKYLDLAIQLAKNFEVDDYLKQSLELTKERIEEYFGREKEKQAGLVNWV